MEEWGLYLRFRTFCEAEIQYVKPSDNINAIFKHFHPLLDLFIYLCHPY